MTDTRDASATPTLADALERALLHRLEEVERDNRRLRRLGLYMLVGVGALLGLAAAFVVVAARHGMPGFVPELAEAHRFVVRDDEGRLRAALGMSKEGNAQVVLQDVGGRDRLRLSVLPDGGAGVAFVDSAGNSRLVLGLLPDQSASVVLADAGGKTRTVLGLSPNGASTILFADKGGTARAGLGVDTRGGGSFTLVDRSGADLTGASPESAPEPQQPAETSATPPPAAPRKR